MAAKSSTAEHSPGAALPDITRVTQETGLCYTSDGDAGIERRRAGDDFVYAGANGKPITRAHVLERIRRLAIPPAWEDVWICRLDNGHLQATGRDARGRKQYRYHARWRETRDEHKFHRLLAFAHVLPRIRLRVRKVLKQRYEIRETMLATIVYLLEATLIRVGNDEYARDNHSYGLTTLQNRHVQVNGGSITFAFRGKSGKLHEISLHDPRLARIVKHCRDVPGQRLFTYTDKDGVAHNISSHDVNEYLQEIAGDAFTAKDFRTWAGTILAAKSLREFDPVTSASEATRNVVAAVKAVALMLGNTPAICRKCYVHPAIIRLYIEGVTIRNVGKSADAPASESPSRLKADEQAVVALLQRELRDARRKKRSRSTQSHG